MGLSEEWCQRFLNAIFVAKVNVHEKLGYTCAYFQTYLVTSLLYIPENITLPEDNIQEQNQFSQADEEKVDAEIEELKKKIHGVRPHWKIHLLTIQPET